MKLIVDTLGKQVTVSRETVEKTEQNGRQKQERGTGRLMWSTQVFVLDDDGGEVITVTTAGEKPNVKVGQLVALFKLEALPWATNGRNGVAFPAEEIKAASMLSIRKSCERACRWPAWPINRPRQCGRVRRGVYPGGGGCAQVRRSSGLAFQGRKRSRSGPGKGLPPLRPHASR